MREICANGCQAGFKRISDNSAAIGMKVNPTKTQLLCVSGASYCETNCHFFADGVKISSQPSMTLLGFCFGNRPTVEDHIHLIQKKFNSRSWLPRHLRNAGVPQEDIVKIYASTIRSVVEYAVPVYHPLLTANQADKLESLQRRALKSIFDPKTSYREALERSGLDTLQQRRESIFRKFCMKTSQNSLFYHWLHKNPPSAYNLRKENRYVEFHARSERLKKSPLFAMRRAAY